MWQSCEGQIPTMEAGSVVRAVFDFCPSVSEELPLFVGDVIEVLAVIDEFWLLGKKEGVTGQFPSSFVEPVDVPLLKQGEKLFVCTSNFTSQEAGSLTLQRGDLVILDGPVTSSQLQGRSGWGSRGFFPSSCVQELCLSAYSPRSPYCTTLEMPTYALGQARALMGLSAQLEEELDFREGDVITIVGIPEPGWFEGELGGHRGIFPEGFVELLGPLKATSSSQEPKSGSEIHSVNGTKGMYPKAEEKAWSDSEEELAGPYGVALYQFQALESAELDFEVGDRIRILGVLEDGWLEGELRGRRGIFPHRFVRLEESSLPSQEKWESGCLTEGADPEATTTHQEGPLALRVEPAWNLVCAEEKLGVLSARQEGLPDSELKQTETLNRQNEACLESLPSGSPLLDSAKAVNGVSRIPPPSHQPKSPHCCQISNPDSGLSPRPSWHPSEDQSASEWDEDTQSLSHTFVPLCEERAACKDVQRRKPKSRSSSFSGTHEGLDTWPVWRSARIERSQGVLHGESCGDLDSKLTEQLTQFEQSLASPSSHASYGIPQQDNISRHFSILGFSSEKDIVRGSVEHTSQRRKALRPPPPRPSTPASAVLRLPAGHSPQAAPPPQNLPISVRPSRPAPLPPSGNQRRSPAPAKLHLGSKEGQSSPEESRGTSPCSFLLKRIQELEQELDVYRKTRSELSAMLEQPQGRVETLENLDFCDCKMSSLNLELQELRGEYNNPCSLRRGANAEGDGQQGDHDWDNGCQTRELCGPTRPVDRAYGGFRKSWCREHYLARGCWDCEKEGRQYVDQKRRSGSHLYVQHETVGGRHLEEAGYHSDCESTTAVGYWKPYGWYYGYPDADFGGSRNRDGRGTNHWREGSHYHAYRERDNWSRGSHSLDLDYEKGDDGYVDCSRSGGRYCQKDYGLNMVRGDAPLKFGHCGIPEDCAVDDRNLSVAHEDQVSEGASSGQELEPASEVPRPQEVAENDCGETGMVAVQSLGLRVSKSGCPRTRAGRSDWSLDWEEEGVSTGGTEAWQRNSCYRRTAPSALRHHIKGKQ
ncbi:hypothetical protein lerEdw1_014773, partial [Lerista edwardsae]